MLELWAFSYAFEIMLEMMRKGCGGIAVCMLEGDLLEEFPHRPLLLLFICPYSLGEYSLLSFWQLSSPTVSASRAACISQHIPWGFPRG